MMLNEKLLPKAKVLYNNPTGSNESITLNDDVSNYNYLEIFYTDNQKTMNASTKIVTPNNKMFLLTFVNNYKQSNGTIYNYLYIKKMKASGNTLTKELETYLQINTTTITSLRETDYVYITKVLGYK